jgi:hypothetical protein
LVIVTGGGGGGRRNENTEENSLLSVGNGWITVSWTYSQNNLAKTHIKPYPDSKHKSYAFLKPGDDLPDFF